MINRSISDKLAYVARVAYLSSLFDMFDTHYVVRCSSYIGNYRRVLSDHKGPQGCPHARNNEPLYLKSAVNCSLSIYRGDPREHLKTVVT